MTVPKYAAWIGAYLALLLVVFAAYHGTLHQFFVADDFAHLHFVRASKLPLLRYLDPTASFSDPVTSARYLPIKVYCLLALERAFGLDAGLYHATSILLHALNALVVGHLAKTLFACRATGVVAALLFATSRVNAQNVCWMVCLPNLLGALLLFTAIAVALRPKTGAPPVALTSLLLLLSFLCRSDAVTALAFLVPQWLFEALRGGRRTSLWLAAGAAMAASITTVLGAINLRYFPEPGMHIGFLPQRIPAFFVDLFVPFDIPMAARAGLVVALLAAAAHTRDKRVGYLLYGIALSAVFWAFVVYLRLTPRYFYTASALSSILLAALSIHWARRLLPRRGEVAAIALAACLAFIHVRCIARDDVVWFDYLSEPARKLAALKHEQRERGAKEPLRVTVNPFPLLVYADLAFFRPELVIVRDGTHTMSVDSDVARFSRHYGADVGRSFWRFPWLVE